MNRWIPTSERLPAREDAGDWGVVNVIRKTDFPTIGAIPVDAVNEHVHSHWAKLPDKPEGE